jgi:hypothetical protein
LTADCGSAVNHGIQKRTCIAAQIAATQVRFFLFHINNGMTVQYTARNNPMISLGFF